MEAPSVQVVEPGPDGAPPADGAVAGAIEVAPSAGAPGPSAAEGVPLGGGEMEMGAGDDDDDDDDEEGPPRKKRGGHGRRKIEIEYIEDKIRRHITFSKRKAGISKKAYELSRLTGAQVGARALLARAIHRGRRSRPHTGGPPMPHVARE